MWEHAGLPGLQKETKQKKAPTLLLQAAGLRRSGRVISLLKVREKGKDEITFPQKKKGGPVPLPKNYTEACASAPLLQQGVLEELGSLSAPGPEVRWT